MRTKSELYHNKKIGDFKLSYATKHFDKDVALTDLLQAAIKEIDDVYVYYEAYIKGHEKEKDVIVYDYLDGGLGTVRLVFRPVDDERFGHTLDLLIQIELDGHVEDKYFFDLTNDNDSFIERKLIHTMLDLTTNYKKMGIV